MDLEVEVRQRRDRVAGVADEPEHVAGVDLPPRSASGVAERWA
jgi:hypothetical protein